MNAGYLIKHVTGTFFFFFIMFICAGRLDFWQGWLYVTIGLIMFTLNYTVLKPDAELLSERSKPGEGIKSSDKKLLGLSFLLTILMFAVAGIDSGRFHLSPGLHWSLYLTGLLLTVTGQLLFLIAQKQNRYFSSALRIQTDRNHTVCEKGLYKIVRHPAYLGSIIQSMGFPLIMGSLWSIIPAGLLILIWIIRTYLEDNTLKSELKGYLDYTDKTPYRIIPLIW